MTEFEVIEQYFAEFSNADPDVRCGIGDDAAIIRVPQGMELALSIDSLVAGVHFSVCTTPADIAHKSLAVNLSDMAAMGAIPRWVMLSLSLPTIEHYWLEEFMCGFGKLAKYYGLGLIGGDLSRGPLSVTIQISGLLPENTGLKRSGAAIGDRIYVTGTLGDAGLALAVLEERKNVSEAHLPFLQQRLNRPEPRIEAGLALRTIASSAIDISDGLSADLGHIIKASSVGAEIEMQQLPLSATLSDCLTAEVAWRLALTSGDDYELCCTIAAENCAIAEKKLSNLDCAFTCIGTIVTQPSIRYRYSDGSIFKLDATAYQHF